MGIFGAGINHIDVAELKKRGIRAANTPAITANAVADIAVMLALGASRRIHEGRLKIEQYFLNSYTLIQNFSNFSLQK